LNQGGGVVWQKNHFNVTAEVNRGKRVFKSIVKKQENLERQFFLLIIGFQFLVNLEQKVITENFKSSPGLTVGLPNNR
jgi:hypothetical protein